MQVQSHRALKKAFPFIDNPATIFNLGFL